MRPRTQAIRHGAVAVVGLLAGCAAEPIAPGPAAAPGDAGARTQASADAPPPPQPLAARPLFGRAGGGAPPTPWRRVTPAPLTSPPIPDFGAIRDPSSLKQTFYEYLSPVVVAENERIHALRRRLESLQARRAGGGRLLPTDRAWLESLAHRYELPVEPGPVSLTRLEGLLRRVDTVPRELALAQAAIESGWGRSRFTRLGNNIYGHWCFSPGCGLVPEARPEGADGEIGVYDSPAESVRAYLHNLNTHPPYAGLRELRAQQRLSADTLDAHALAHQLLSYSTLREAYVHQVLTVMRQNRNLARATDLGAAVASR